MIAELFVNPLILPFNSTLWLLLPLCASVAIVYKAIRVDSLRRLPLQAGVLIVYMLGGLFTLGASLWAIHEFWP
jgi:hypothetical protein